MKGYTNRKFEVFPIFQISEIIMVTIEKQNKNREKIVLSCAFLHLTSNYYLFLKIGKGYRRKLTSYRKMFNRKVFKKYTTFHVNIFSPKFFEKNANKHFFLFLSSQNYYLFINSSVMRFSYVKLGI